MTGHPRSPYALMVAEEAVQLWSGVQQSLGTWYQREHGQR